MITPETSVWRVVLLREFELNDQQLRQIQQPTLIVASGRDKVLPSLDEAERLSYLLPHAQIHILPDSGHACLLEADVNLYEILRASHVLPQAKSVAESAES
jgi:pimeloyl-ACP methyl ester carboxylesterase